MKTYWWSALGLILDICGAFLLSVEAIKIENIRKLRDLYLGGLFTTLRGPEVVFTNDPKPAKRGLPVYIIIYMGIHYVAGAVLLIVADIAIARLFGLNLGMWIVQAIWHLPIVLRVITIILGGLIFVVVGLWLLGELVVHGIMQNAVKGIMAILEAIDRSTLKGTTGIIGFALIFLGFLGQLIGTIAGAH